jgi:hypothetical protein
MIIHRLLVVLLILVTGLIVMIGLFKGLGFFIKNGSVRFLISIGLFIGAIIILHFSIATVYIIENNEHVRTRFILGNPDFRFQNGNIMKVKFNGKWGLINNINDTLYLETVSYSTSRPLRNIENKIDTIKPYNILSIEKKVHYFFNDRPPETILVEGFSEKRFWLHSNN